MINESSLAAIEELDIFQPKLDDMKTPSFQEAQEAVAQALQVLKEFYAKALGSFGIIWCTKSQHDNLFSKVKVAWRWMTRNDWRIDALLPYNDSPASNAWLAEKTRRVKPLLWFRAMRRRPSPNRRGTKVDDLLMFVLLTSPVYICYICIYIYTYIENQPPSPTRVLAEIWGTPAWATRAVVSSAWWRQLGLRQNGNETRLTFKNVDIMASWLRVHKI